MTSGIKVIKSFRGRYAWLSNFYRRNFIWKGLMLPHREGAFQMEKCANESEKKQFLKLSPQAAKRNGGPYGNITLRDGWEDDKLKVMYEVNKAFFDYNKDLKDKLIATGDAILIEGNTWNDTYWGQVDGEGENHLGRILMELREEYKKELLQEG